MLPGLGTSNYLVVSNLGSLILSSPSSFKILHYGNVINKLTFFLEGGLWQNYSLANVKSGTMAAVWGCRRNQSLKKNLEHPQG
jgi:hypothetical protein